MTNFQTFSNFLTLTLVRLRGTERKKPLEIKY